MLGKVNWEPREKKKRTMEDTSFIGAQARFLDLVISNKHGKSSRSQ